MKQTELIYNVIYKVYRKLGRKYINPQGIKDYQDKRVYGDEMNLAIHDIDHLIHRKAIQNAEKEA